MHVHFHNLLSRLRPKPSITTVQVSDAGVVLLEDGRQWERFAWDEVQDISIFKRDLGIVDDIRLTFRVKDHWIEVSEEAVGWSMLSAALGHRFPMIPSDWYAQVISPPFATCYRVLYERG